MRLRLATVLGLALLAPGLVAAAEPSACVGCHRELVEHLLAPLADWEADVHGEAGLGCEGCHGGDASPELVDDAEASMDPAAGFRPVPGRLEIAAFCGNCHADAEFMKRFDPAARIDQLAEYRTSAHGKATFGGDPVPATCTDCHGVHGIREARAPDSPVNARNVPETCARCHADPEVMGAYGLPTGQYAEYLESEHGAALLVKGDTGAPACNDCHGNHGATPPGVTSVANVCGQCHLRESQLFRASLKKDLFDAMEVSECAVCHGNHRVLHPTSEMFRTGSGPRVSHGSVQRVEPLLAAFGDVAAGEVAEADWIVVRSPGYAVAGEPVPHRLTVSAGGLEPVRVAVDLAGGAVPPGEPAQAATDAMSVELSAGPGSGRAAGEPIRLSLRVTARRDLSEVRAEERAEPGVHDVAGSVCMDCHAPGDDCDVATGRMYEALDLLQHEYREASETLHRAEVAGMAVRQTQFDLDTKGKTGMLEARALIHAFDPDLSVAQVEQAREPIAAALAAGRAALDELAFRRKGLAVSLVLIVLVAVGLWLKIREVGPGY